MDIVVIGTSKHAHTKGETLRAYVDADDYCLLRLAGRAIAPALDICPTLNAIHTDR